VRVLVTGAGGQLATDLVRVLDGQDLVALSHRELEVCDPVQLRSALEAVRPDVVINTAAFHRVDDCEAEAERAFAVNTLGVRNLALACAEAKASLLHVSTDYVFDGSKRQPYLEEDAALPINVYGASKLAGELLVRALLDNYYIVRSSGLYGCAGASGKGGNFVNTMLRLAREKPDIKVVDDQRLSPTYTRDLAEKLAWLIRTEGYGLYHVTNSGGCSWYEFAYAIFEQAGLKPRVQPISTEAFGARARRPAYSVLGHGSLEHLGCDDLPHWSDALQRYLAEKHVVRS
jgi:dTDP-4-dehydrorhamnose reductase